MIIKAHHSPNFSKKNRKIKDIKFIIIHYTGMQSKIESFKRLISPKSKVSCHYLIDRKGIILELVKLDKIAWHAGNSKWKNNINLNRCSVGIELVNKGHKFGYEKFTDIQIKKLLILCNKLKKKLKIKDNNILGHSDIAPLRKLDPGEKFPWEKFGLTKKLSKIKKSKFLEKRLQKKIREKLFFSNLFKIGYRYFKKEKRSITDKLVIKAFQRRFLQKNVTGNLDQKTFEISHFLANQLKI